MGLPWTSCTPGAIIHVWRSWASATASGRNVLHDRDSAARAALWFARWSSAGEAQNEGCGCETRDVPHEGRMRDGICSASDRICSLLTAVRHKNSVRTKERGREVHTPWFRTMFRELFRVCLGLLRDGFRGRAKLVAENALLRQRPRRSQTSLPRTRMEFLRRTASGSQSAPKSPWRTAPACRCGNRRAIHRNRGHS